MHNVAQESKEALEYLALADDLQKSSHFESAIEYYSKGLGIAKDSLLRSALLFNRSVAQARLGFWDKVCFFVNFCFFCKGHDHGVGDDSRIDFISRFGHGANTPLTIDTNIVCILHSAKLVFD